MNAILLTHTTLRTRFRRTYISLYERPRKKLIYQLKNPATQPYPRRRTKRKEAGNDSVYELLYWCNINYYAIHYLA